MASDEERSPKSTTLMTDLAYVNKTTMGAEYEEVKKRLTESRAFASASTERERALLIAHMRLLEILAFGEAKTLFPSSHHA